jgi:hypothetical protein
VVPTTTSDEDPTPCLHVTLAVEAAVAWRQWRREKALCNPARGASMLDVYTTSRLGSGLGYAGRFLRTVELLHRPGSHEVIQQTLLQD